MNVNMNVAKLEKALGYVFLDKEVIKHACTHRSYGPENNERLEFLGDVVLSAVISEYLYHHEMKWTEGELTRKRAWLVNGKTLVTIAKSIDLGAYLHLGGSEQVAGRSRASILEDALEAVIAVIYLEGGWLAAKAVILNLWKDKLEAKLPVVTKDAKTQLQEWLQASNLPLPSYETEVRGPLHEQVFTAACQVVGIEFISSGEGQTKREAEQEAAKKMQLWLEKK
jgi:ribonuclease-3